MREVGPFSQPQGRHSSGGPGMIKVCLVAPFVPPYGGMALQAQKLLKVVSCYGYEIVPVRVNRPPGKTSFLDRVPMVRTLSNTVRFFRELVPSLAGSDVVVVFSSFFNYFFWVTLPTILVAHGLGKGVILSARGGGAGAFCRRYKYVLRPVMQKVDLVTAPSPFLAKVFEAEFGLETAIVPTVVDTQRFSFRPRFPLQPKILAARHLEVIYGVDVILKAFKNIRDVYPKASLTIAGDGSQANTLKTQAKNLGLEQSVNFLGSVPHERMPDAYNAHDIFVNASRVDNLPNAILEAFASGLPVVSTKAGGIPYLVEDGRTGVLVDVDDWEGLARGVLYLLGFPEKAYRMASNARTEAEKHAEDEVMSHFVESIERALAKKGRKLRLSTQTAGSVSESSQ